MDKVDLRKAMLVTRRAISPGKWPKINEAVVTTLKTWPRFLRAQTIMAYMAMKDEVSLQDFIDCAWKLDKVVAVPKMTAEFGQMNAIIIQPDSAWTVAAFGIREPLAEIPICASKLDIIFLSGVAFDKNGHRLGMGGGYYDRFLLRAQQAYIVGVTTDSQLVDDIPCGPYDRSVDAIVTESGIIYCDNCL